MDNVVLSAWIGWSASLLLLTAMGVLGMLVLRRGAPFLNLVELVAYGVPLGVVVASLVLLALVAVSGLHLLLVINVGVACIVGVILLWPHELYPRRLPSLWKRPATTSGIIADLPTLPRFSRSVLVPAGVLAAFALRWLILWSGALTFDDSGLWAGHVYIWGDWTQHLGDVTSFVYGNSLPGDHPRFAQHAYSYHYLASLTAAALVELGLPVTTALTFTSFLFSLLIALGVFAFAHRVTGDQQAAALTLVLLLLGGGFGWLVTAATINSSHSVFGTLLEQPWNVSMQDAARFLWHNMYFSLIEPQRGYLYGLPLCLLILTLLFAATRTHDWLLFAAAGSVAGMLPFAHLSSLLALALITPFLFLLFPSRGWLLFFGGWLILALPQLYLQQGGQRGATAAFRMQLGWVAAPDPWLWFWLKNLGWFLPLLGFALADRQLLHRHARRFLWGMMPVFVITNLVVFQPWDWDNIKFMLYWFLAVCILVAALIVKLWRLHRSAVVRTLLGGVVLSMILSGLLVNLNQLLGKDRHLLLTTEELRLAEAIREQTPPDAIFVAGLQHNHPVTVISGRQVVLGYTGVLWAQGIDYQQREHDVRAIYQFASEAPQLLASYQVDYVVIGPNEREQLTANLDAFRQRYPRILATEQYEVFSINQQ